jgi:hypothetical protein
VKALDRITKSDHLQKHAPAASIQARLHNGFFFLCGFSSSPAGSGEGMHRSPSCSGGRHSKIPPEAALNRFIKVHYSFATICGQRIPARIPLLLLAAKWVLATPAQIPNTGP